MATPPPISMIEKWRVFVVARVHHSISHFILSKIVGTKYLSNALVHGSLTAYEFSSFNESCQSLQYDLSVVVFCFFSTSKFYFDENNS